ncbi:MAG: PilC/PilY family type IV pilus protein [Gammaproteobacteria bacterium]|nr:PilC/PilY family type IV pilus protein [Gammaproteobacteria bacterium]
MTVVTRVAAWVCVSLLPSNGSTREFSAPVEETVQVRAHPGAAGKSWRRVAVAALPDGLGYAAHSIPGGGDGSESRNELWRFTDTHLGQAQGRVRIALSNAQDSRGEGEWAAIFGGGHGLVAGGARLFVVFIDRGVDGWDTGDFVSITTGVRAPVDDTETPASNGLGEPALVDTDLDGSADLAYAGDLLGNLYRFDISGSDPSSWRAVRLFQAGYGGPPSVRQPIAERPFVVRHPGQGGFLVVFGTGRGPPAEDPAGTDIQSIYGIWDPGGPDPATAGPRAKGERLVGRSLVNLVDESSGSFETRRVLTGEPVRYARDAPGRRGVYGWYIDLDMPRARQTLQGNPNPDRCGGAPPDAQYPGERVAGRPIPRGNLLFMATVIPRDTPHCAAAPPGSVLAIDMVTGGSAGTAVLDLNDDGHIGRDDLVPFDGGTAASGIVLDGTAFSGVPCEPELVSGRDGSAILVVGEGGDALSLSIGSAGKPRTGRLSWREIPVEGP